MTGAPPRDSAPGPSATGVQAPRFGAPIAVQIIALLVAVLILGQAATFLVISILPPPRPPVYRIEEIAAALKGAAVTPRFAPPFVRAVQAAPPAESSGRDFRSRPLKAELAHLLGASQDDVRLEIAAGPGPGFPFRGNFRHHGMMEPPPPDGPGGLTGSPPAQDGLIPPPAPPPPPPEGPGAAPPEAAGPPPWERRDFGQRPWRGFRPGQALGRMGFAVGEITAAYQARPGRWTVVRSPTEGFPTAWQRRMMLWFLACLVVLTPVGYLFARRLTAPIRRFAAAADQLGRGLRGPPIALRGPAEISVAAAAFNVMQARLARYVEDRTAMIGAIAHDLRTPLARVQFKLQRAPVDLAADIRADLGQMEAMIAAVLAFVRDAAPAHDRGPLDLRSLLEVVADDAVATGAEVALEPGPAVIVDADASALQRLFVNLVDNAVKYGGAARLRIVAQPGEDVVVQVSDPGPGVEPTDLERVFEPFYRVESSRSRETGGIGLGLSVARSIARAHGGDVTLASGGEGLTATVRLPGAAPARP